MSYTKHTWEARQGTDLNRFTKSNETETSVDLTSNPTAITALGTPFNVEWLNEIEKGVDEANQFPQSMYSNGIVNGDMSEWISNKTYTPALSMPARWEINLPSSSGGTITKVDYEASIAPYAMRVKLGEGSTVGAPWIVYYFTEDESKIYRGKFVTCSFSARVGTSVIENFRFRLLQTNGSAIISTTFKPNFAAETNIFTSGAIIPNDATGLYIEIDCPEFFENSTIASANWYIDITNFSFSATDFYIPFSPDKQIKSAVVAVSRAFNAESGTVYVPLPFCPKSVRSNLIVSSETFCHTQGASDGMLSRCIKAVAPEGRLYYDQFLGVLQTSSYHAQILEVQVFNKDGAQLLWTNQGVTESGTIEGYLFFES